MKLLLRARPLARLAGVACLTMPHGAYAADDQPIVVTAAPTEPDPTTTEGRTARELRETTALLTAEDTVRYLPSLMVRRRHVGDTQAPLATRTSGVGASARSLIYVDGVLLSALIGNNNSTASPRWGLVSPEEIAGVEVRYGPFSAAYPGNSIGAVVNIATRAPQEPEATLMLGASRQAFDQYGTNHAYPAVQVAGTFGTKLGPVSLFAAANHLDSRGQPLAYATVARPVAASGAGTAVSGAYEDVNRTGGAIFVLGASGIEHNVQDNLKLKAAVEPGAGLKLTYLGGLFLNRSAADAETYLDQDRYAGTLNIQGRAVTVPATAFSNNVYRLDERHSMHALTLESKFSGIDVRATGSTYRFDKSEQRIPSGPLPAARSGGAGSLVDLSGTGWDTFDLSLGRSDLTAGAHEDRVRLQSHRYATAEWLSGPTGALLQASEGRTRTRAIWAQQAVTVIPSLVLTLGARYEWWHADRGVNYSLSPALDVAQPEQSADGLSPKATLLWLAGGPWSVSLSAAQAYRFPTVQELYQAVTTGPTLTVPNPDLKPERARSAELTIQHQDGGGKVRVSLFGERIGNALISQTAPLVTGSTALFSYVQNVPLTRAYGLELAFERRGVLLPQLDVSGSFTVVDPKIVSDPAFHAAEGKDIPQVPRRRGTLVLTWHEGEEASFTIAARYASRSFATIDNSDTITHTFQGFDGYFLADVRAAFRLTPRLDAALGIENLLDERYFLFHPFPGRTLTAELHLRL